MTKTDQAKFKQLLVDLKEVAYQSGDTMDRQGEYISDNILHIINRLEDIDIED